MKHLFLILALVFAGLANTGIGLDSDASPGMLNGICQGSRCEREVVRTTCCGEVITERVCSMSQGRCQCKGAPDHLPQRQPTAPLPRSDRDLFSAVPLSSPTVVEALPIESRGPLGSHRLLVVRSSYSHNKIQAHLGVWHT